MWHYSYSSPNRKGGGVWNMWVNEHLTSTTVPSSPPYLSILTCITLLPALSSQLYTVSSIGHTPSSHRACACLLPLRRILFPILLPFPLPQPFYLVGFHFLAISAKHNLLRELFLKLFPSHKYHYRNVLFGKFIILCRFMFLIVNLWPSLSYISRMETVRDLELYWFFFISIVSPARKK